ncbi:MAG: hypothetical protein MJY49_05805 [Bacteroidales bacterium]|nr:hypothetical protein [Bacteroidales bacterium]
MKKFLILLTVFILSTFSANAQTKVFCELIGKLTMSGKVTVRVDFGQKTNFFADNRLVDENGRAIVFNSMIDAVNHMSAMGWEFEQAYGVALGSQQIGSEVYHYVLSKKIGTEGDPNPAKTKDMYDQEQRDAEAINTNE